MKPLCALCVLCGESLPCHRLYGSFGHQPLRNSTGSPWQELAQRFPGAAPLASSLPAPEATACREGRRCLRHASRHRVLLHAPCVTARALAQAGIPDRSPTLTFVPFHTPISLASTLGRPYAGTTESSIRHRAHGAFPLRPRPRPSCTVFRSLRTRPSTLPFGVTRLAEPTLRGSNAALVTSSDLLRLQSSGGFEVASAAFPSRVLHSSPECICFAFRGLPHIPQQPRR